MGFLQQRLHDLQVHVHIVNNQYLRLRRIKPFRVLYMVISDFPDSVRIISDRFRIKYLLRNADEKYRPFPIFTFHGYLAIHQKDQLSRNGQSQSRSFNSAVSVFVQPLIGGKKSVHILRSDPDSGVPHFYLEINHIRSQLLIADPELHTALPCIFHRIGQNIDHDLTQPHFITIEFCRDLSVILHNQFQALGIGPHDDHVIAIVN